MNTYKNLDEFREIACCNTRINRQLYQVVASLLKYEIKCKGNTFLGSIYETLSYTLLTDLTWLDRFSHNTKYEFQSLANIKSISIQELDTDFDSLWQTRQQTDEIIESWIDELEPDILCATIHYQNSQGNICEYPLWFALAHFFNQQTHNRRHITNLFYQLDSSYSISDLLFLHYIDQLN